MDTDRYRKKFFVHPPPQSRFSFAGLHGLTLYFSNYTEAVEYYQRVLGPPAYVEGDDTRGWQLGDTWLTLLKGGTGTPQNVEVMIVMQTPMEAERLQAAFIAAGGSGEEPSDQLMYEVVRYCPVRDPFGTNLLIFCPLQGYQQQEATRQTSITIRPGQESDAPAFRALRLEALRTHPEAFGSDFESNEKLPLSHWADRLRALGDETMIYFAEHDSDLIGICGIARENRKKSRHSATIFSVYIQPEWRGQHIAERLIEHCLQWAQDQGIIIVKLAVVITNTAAIRCYARCGFTVYGVDPHVINLDGVFYDELLMVRRIP